MHKTLRLFTMKRLILFAALYCFHFGTSQTQRFNINWGKSITLGTYNNTNGV